jgi:hypothetical protein
VPKISTKAHRNRKAAKPYNAGERLAKFEAHLLKELFSFRESADVSREQMKVECDRLGTIPLAPLAAGLVRFRKTEKRFRSLGPDSRSVRAVREHMSRALAQSIMLLAVVLSDDQGRVMVPTALLELASAFEDICEGSENALLVPASRSGGSSKFLPSHHRYVRATAAAIVELLVVKGQMPKLAAADVVAGRLSKAGYRLCNSKASSAIKADTVKRWPERERAKKAKFSGFHFHLELWSECVTGPDDAKWVAHEELAKLAEYCKRSALKI